MRSTSTTLLALLLAACLPAPPPPDAPPEIRKGVATALPTAALLDPYVGDYRNGENMIRVRRNGSGLVVERSGSTVPEALTLIGLDTFADTKGNSYLFTTARGAPATRLAIIGANGTRRWWVR